MSLAQSSPGATLRQGGLGGLRVPLPAAQQATSPGALPAPGSRGILEPLHGVEDHFDLCLATCGTSSRSLQNENTYRDSHGQVLLWREPS